MSTTKHRITACILAACMTGMSVPMTVFPSAIIASAADETLTAGDSITFTGNLSGVENGKTVEVAPPELADRPMIMSMTAYGRSAHIRTPITAQDCWTE